MAETATCIAKNIGPRKSCCDEVREALLKSEGRRNSLRQAIKLLEQQIVLLESEKITIQKDYEKEKSLAEREREEKEKECAIRRRLEEELSQLRAEIDELKGKDFSQEQYEIKIKELQELLQKKRKRGDTAGNKPAKKTKVAEKAQSGRNNSENKMAPERCGRNRPANKKTAERADHQRKKPVSKEAGERVHSGGNKRTEKKKAADTARLEHAAFSAAASSKSAKENLQPGSAFVKLSGEVIEKRHDDKIGSGPTRSDKHHLDNESEDVQFDSSPHHQGDSLCTLGGYERKTKGDQNGLNSVAYLSSKDKKLLLEMEGKISALYEVLCMRNNMPSFVSSKGGQGSEPVRKKCSSDNGCTKIIKSGKKRRKVLRQENLLLSCEADIEGYLTQKLETEGDYMKLLELDNDVDEEKYRIAMAKPLSPTLPEIRSPKHEGVGIDGTVFLREGGFFKPVDRGEDDLNQYKCFDIINVEINSNILRSRSTNNYKRLSSDAFKRPCISVREVRDDGGNIHNVCVNECQEVSISSHLNGIGNECSYFVLVSTIKDGRAIDRMLHARDKCLYHRSVFSQANWELSEVLLAVASEESLAPEEKACLFFSMLLCNLTPRTSTNTSSYDAVTLCADSNAFAGEISKGTPEPTT